MLVSVTTLLTAAAALAAVLGLVLLLARLARRTGLAAPAGRDRRIAVQEAIALDARRRLHLVRCDGRDCLILTGAHTDLVVGWLEPRP